jgi:hypothetical protein
MTIEDLVPYRCYHIEYNNHSWDVVFTEYDNDMCKCMVINGTLEEDYYGLFVDFGRYARIYEMEDNEEAIRFAKMMMI